MEVQYELLKDGKTPQPQRTRPQCGDRLGNHAAQELGFLALILQLLLLLFFKIKDRAPTFLSYCFFKEQIKKKTSIAFVRQVSVFKRV